MEEGTLGRAERGQLAGRPAARRRGQAVRGAAIAAAVGFLLLACFQVALALGVPWGRAAWGGAHERLPRGLRIASGLAAVFWILAAFVVLSRAGFEWSPVPITVVRWGTWVLVGLLGIGMLMNLASRSKLERSVQTPVAAILGVLCLLVALR
jgi:hypothetical protein